MLITPFHAFGVALFSGKHDFSTHAFKFALSNTAPTASSNDELADISEVSYTNLTGTRAVVIASVAQTAGLLSVSLSSGAHQAVGGSVGPFRYIVLYNDTTSGKPLVGFWTLGSSQTLQATKYLNITPSAAVLQVQF
jgi:hypothetical protein